MEICCMQLLILLHGTLFYDALRKCCKTVLHF
jgi:hypothetical protein